MFQRIVERMTKELTDSFTMTVHHCGPEAHAPNCTVIECDEFIEWRRSSTRSTQHVCDGEKVWAVICRDVVEGKEAKVNAQLFARTLLQIEVCEGNALIAKSEASVLIDQADQVRQGIDG